MNFRNICLKGNNFFNIYNNFEKTIVAKVNYQHYKLLYKYMDINFLKFFVKIELFFFDRV